jgi:hypothetical protein
MQFPIPRDTGCYCVTFREPRKSLTYASVDALERVHMRRRENVDNEDNEIRGIRGSRPRDMYRNRKRC